MNSADYPFLEELDGELRLRIRLAPRSSRNRFMGIHDGRLKVAVTAPPVEGKANECLVAFLAKVLKCAKGCIRIEKGELSKEKLVSITGIGLERMRAALDSELGSA